MKKYKLLYFVSEDEYFITHKINQAKTALKFFDEIKIMCKFSNYSRKIELSGFKTINFNLNRKSINPILNLKSLIKFFSITTKYKPDVIQCFALKPILYSIIINFFLKRDIKILCCVVGMGYLIINKNLFARVYKSIYFFLLKIFINKKVFFVFQNSDDYSLFRRKKIISKNNSSLIRGSGVCTKKFKSNNQKKIYDLIFHSRIIKDKGVFEIIDAIKILRNQNVFFKTLFLGDIDNANRSFITEKQVNFWVKEKLIIWKRKTNNVLPYLQKSKISILPSYREGLPKSLLEAASCKLPIISTDVPGCREVCINNFNGFLVQPKDSGSLSKSIQKLLFNSNLMKKFGRNSREIVTKNFSDQIVSNEFLKLYQEVIKKAL
jgi:glycosyltransferase involved in cell wall biosynthesis